jgi:transcriptional regulator with XRE-family HTH domain
MKDLVEIRKKLKLTQQQVAERAGMNRAYYTMIEAGFRRPSPEVAMRIGKALDFDWTRFYEPEKEAIK